MIKLLFNPWTFGIVLLLAIMAGVSLQQTGQKAQTAADQRQSLETEVTALQLKVSASAAQASASANPFMKEKIARDELLWQKPGETVIELPATAPTPTSVVAQTTLTPWQAWKKLLFTPNR
jgi:cell division protein FtsB